MIRKKNTNKNTFIKKLTLKQLAALNIHYAGEDHLLNSLMIEWVFGKRYGKLIIDLRFSLIQWKKSIFFLSHIIGMRGKILYMDSLSEFGEYNEMLNYFVLLGQHFLNGSFSGGFLSNFKYIYYELVKIFFNQQRFVNRAQVIPLAEENSLTLVGVKNLRRPPNVIFLPDGERNFWISKSSVQVRIPAVTIVDPNFYIHGIFLPIPGSTATTFSFSVIVFILLSIFVKGILNEFKHFFASLRRKNIRRKFRIFVSKRKFIAKRKKQSRHF